MLTITRQALEQTLLNAQTELQTITTELDELAIRLPANEAETVTIQARQTQRSHRLKTLQETLAQRTGQHEELAARERSQAGTLADGNLSDQVKVADRERRKAEKNLADEQGKQKKEADRDQARLTQLREAQGTLVARKAELEHKQVLTQQIIDETHAAIGQDEYRDVVLQLELRNKSLEAKQRELGQEREELKLFGPEALQRLERWPELRAKVAARLPYEDPVTHLLSPAIAFLDALFTYGERARREIDWQVASRIRGGDLIDWFALTVEELLPVFGINRRPTMTGRLQERRDQWLQLRNQHVQTKQGEMR